MFRILWDPSSGSIKRASLKLLGMFCVRSRCLAAWNLDKFHAVKHRLPTQNISSNFSEARLILPEDGSQRIRNMSEFLSFKVLIHVDFNLLSFIQLSALVGQ